MYSQKSFDQTTEHGTLFIVPTPIGNLEDITIRSLNTLKSVDIIAAEDTRNTKKLLNHFEITQSLISYHEHNQSQRESMLLDKLKEGNDVALVSDAGMPAISDPGNQIVQAAVRDQIAVVVLPGANAALCALVGSGLDTTHFYFYGFLPRKNKDRKYAFDFLNRIPDTILLYESPYRLAETLQDIKENLGNRQVSIARELTKRFEEYIRGSVHEVQEWLETGMVKGEFCIVIEGNDNADDLEEKNWWEELSIVEHVESLIQNEQISSKDAIKQVSSERNIPKREVYQAYHVN
ncbi:ribosomal RNA small subunit methyltransferase I [Paraliobacillus quinghaiensis]|uniref:Ribosomal RNA small subunit methyltransferase I n=1 Tax=Paraliobacillus quinghaiensis TaxID=470815 RepID=A0A917WVP6_9BACI|nr:16S rRNA (cytidine(1402)-2'-O)-methyltransferase [Paraliobacillus quinghaiensis]GGM36797.1 ribosomal RNA small subunit methyltransferase I [Paraliobacillus quinghaiensis]